MKTLIEYGRLERLYEIKSDLENGSKFNGVIYGENKGKGVNIFVFVDGKKRYIKEVSKEDSEIVKQEVAKYLGAKQETKTEWTVDGKTVKNNLTYAEMYEKYGMDFE